MVVGHALMVNMCSFLYTSHIGMPVHSSAFLQVGDHSRDLSDDHTTSLSTSVSGTQQGMVWSWVTLHNDTSQDGHPSKY